MRGLFSAQCRTVPISGVLGSREKRILPARSRLIFSTAGIRQSEEMHEKGRVFGHVSVLTYEILGQSGGGRGILTGGTLVRRVVTQWRF